MRQRLKKRLIHRLNKRSFLLRLWCNLAFCLGCLLFLGFNAHADTSASLGPDLVDMDLTNLMDLTIRSASKFEQKATEAPASTTVIAAEEIKRYGYRTL